MARLPHLLLTLWSALDRLRNTPPLPTGGWGERWAMRYLRLHGCRIIDWNVRPCRHGELDIIAKQGKTYLFVEVKTRKDEQHGAPIEAINLRKRQLMRRCATHWLTRHYLLNDHTPYRFDGIEVIGTPRQTTVPDIRWIPNLNMDSTRRPDY